MKLISFSFNCKANLKEFYTKLCVCSHKWKIRNISDGIFILSPGSCTRGGKHGHVEYQIDGDDGQNRMQVKFSS